MQYLVEAIGILTGGLVNDMKTLILGLVVCSFILMALDILKDLILLPLLLSILNPAETYKKSRQLYHDVRFKMLPKQSIYSSPNASNRDGVEISPLRQYDLDMAYRGVDSLPENETSIYDVKQNNWERDGVELSPERFAELDEATKRY